MARVVLVPGFTQTASSWDAVAARLREAGHEPVALDVPVGLDFVATAAALGSAGDRAIYVGYSMGGRLCLRIAVDRPDLVERLVLVSASPGITDPAERDARRAADEELARDVERRGVAPFLRDWLAQPLFSTLDASAAGLTDRAAAHTAAELATTLRLLGSGTQEPLWNRLVEVRMPVALLTGRADSKFEQINDAMQAAFPSAARFHVDGGHALPLEQPDAVAAVVLEWIAGLGVELTSPRSLESDGEQRAEHELEPRGCNQRAHE